MPELQFKGKEFVHNHHLTVPFRPLIPHSAKSIGNSHLDGNLILHGDNLHALKALLPIYAGKVDCIFIDPPYNTGNEGWCYSDSVNSPMVREWLSANPVGIEDGLRHDKWCSMMWPRVRLLHELLADAGSFWMTLDDNEAHRARSVLDEIFGSDNFVAQIEWQKRYTRSNNTDNITSVVDHLIVYRKSLSFKINLTARDDEANARYTNPDKDPRGPWKAIPFLNPAPARERRNLAYKIRNPNTGQETEPKPDDPAWRNEKAIYDRYSAENRFWWGSDGKSSIPAIKRFLSEVKQGMAPINLWTHDFAGNTDDAAKELKEIFGYKAFETPKPTLLIRRVIEHSTNGNSIVLDSFAGSGTTAHAVLAANARDSGNRRFILVEGEDYADTLTAERVRRVINGYDYKGTQREELLREPLTLAKLRRSDTLLAEVQRIETLDGPRYDRIVPTVKDGALIVTGERDVTERAPGLGGTFTYCSLGEPVEMDAILSGAALPDESALANLLWHTATATPLDPAAISKAADIGEGVTRLGSHGGRTHWLIYRPDREWLKSDAAALTLTKARAIKATAEGDHIVFAPAKFVSRELLARERVPVEYAPLPFALYRLETA